MGFPIRALLRDIYDVFLVARKYNMSLSGQKETLRCMIDHLYKMSTPVISFFSTPSTSTTPSCRPYLSKALLAMSESRTEASNDPYSGLLVAIAPCCRRPVFSVRLQYSQVLQPILRPNPRSRHLQHFALRHPHLPPGHLRCPWQK